MQHFFFLFCCLYLCAMDCMDGRYSTSFSRLAVCHHLHFPDFIADVNGANLRHSWHVNRATGSSSVKMTPSRLVQEIKLIPLVVFMHWSCVSLPLLVCVFLSRIGSQSCHWINNAVLYRDSCSGGLADQELANQLRGLAMWLKTTGQNNTIEQ